MKKGLVVLVLVLLTSSFCFGEEPAPKVDEYVHHYKFAEGWTWKDTALQGVFLVETAIDLGQTLDIAKRPGEYYEAINPFLPRHPTEGQVWVWMLASAGVHTLVSMALPPKAEIFGYEIRPRLLWQGVSIVAEGANITRNACIGLRVSY